LTLMNAVWAAGAPVVMTDPQTGALFAWSSTATGDGVYADQEGQQYGVDSGALACLPLVMVDAVQLATRPVHDKSEGAGLLWPPGHLPGAEPVSPLR
jgi:hypothetical protein